MTLSDLDGFHHPATIEGDQVRVRGFAFTPDDFALSGIRLVSYDKAEERELVRLGLLTERHGDGT